MSGQLVNSSKPAQRPVLVSTQLLSYSPSSSSTDDCLPDWLYPSGNRMLPEGMEPPTDSKCYQAWHMGRVTFGRSPTFPQTTPSPITCGDYPTFSVLNASLTSSCARVFDSTLYPTMMGRGSGLIAECKLLPTQSLYAQPVTSVTDCREIYTTQSEQPKIHETLERNYFHEPSYAFSSCSDMIHFDYLDTQGRTVENPFQEPRPSISRLPQSASPRSDEQDTSSWCDSNILDHALPQDEFSERYASNFHLDSMNPTQAIKSHEDHVRSGSQFNFYPESKAATPASRGTSPCGFLALDSPLIKPLDSPRSALRGITCTPDTGQSKSTLLSSAAKDEFLISCKLAGMSYKDIKRKGHYAEAESTLRGRFRTLTKPKLERVRKPIWKDHDVRLLLEAVQEYQNAKEGNYSRTTQIRRNAEIRAIKIPWKKVGQYILNHGGSYHFGNATCRKKWDEIMGGDNSTVERRKSRGGRSSSRHPRYSA